MNNITHVVVIIKNAIKMFIFIKVRVFYTDFFTFCVKIALIC